MPVIVVETIDPPPAAVLGTVEPPPANVTVLETVDPLGTPCVGVVSDESLTVSINFVLETNIVTYVSRI